MSAMAQVQGQALQALLHASVAGDGDTIAGLVTEDVIAWSPSLSVGSREELLAAMAPDDEAFSGVAVQVQGLDHVGDKAIAEWHLSADHTGPLVIDDDLVVDPTGRRLHLSGVTVAEFDGDRICAFRSYFDDLALVEQALAGG